MSELVTLVVHGSLTFFLSTPGSADEPTGTRRTMVPVSSPRTVKDAFESAGVPHPEVERVVVDGQDVGFDHLLDGGERLEVHPPSPGGVARKSSSASPDRFVCDVHLGRLARRLRLLGFDTWYATYADDEELATVAVAEQRVMLTRDRGLLMRRVIVDGYCPRSDDPDTQVQEVVHRYGLGDRLMPLTRCARCNGRLEPVEKHEVLTQLPPRTRVEHDRFSRCTRCGQVYWPGTHVERIAAFVRRAASASTGRRD